jgi:hypothetical protein
MGELQLLLMTDLVVLTLVLLTVVPVMVEKLKSLRMTLARVRMHRQLRKATMLALKAGRLERQQMEQVTLAQMPAPQLQLWPMQEHPPTQSWKVSGS